MTISTFFAPEDDIFDFIVDNAMRSCRGQAAAFAMRASINWIGFVYTRSLYPNERLLVEKGVPFSYLSTFRNYLAVEKVQVPERIRAEGEVPDDKLIREFNLMLQRDFESSKLLWWIISSHTVETRNSSEIVGTGKHYVSRATITKH